MGCEVDGKISNNAADFSAMLLQKILYRFLYSYKQWVTSGIKRINAGEAKPRDKVKLRRPAVAGRAKLSGQYLRNQSYKK